MKKTPKSFVYRMLPVDPAFDLTGKRFGKWIVLKYAGRKVYQSTDNKHSMQMWLCLCDCGVRKKISRGNLLNKLSTQCQRCAWNKRRLERTRLYLLWQRLKYEKALCKKWQNYEVFKKAVGDPPDGTARLIRYDYAKPHGPGNSVWLDRNSVPRVQQIRKNIKEDFILHNKVLKKIRNAKTKDEMNHCLIAARKAGYTYETIGIAAGVSRQWVHQIVTKSME